MCFLLVLKTAAAKKEEKKPILSCASSGHITKLKQSILAFDIYELVTQLYLHIWLCCTPVLLACPQVMSFWPS